MNACNYFLQAQDQKKANDRRNQPMVIFFDATSNQSMEVLFDTSSNQSINGAIINFLMIMSHVLLLLTLMYLILM